MRIGIRREESREGSVASVAPGRYVGARSASLPWTCISRYVAAPTSCQRGPLIVTSLTKLFTCLVVSLTFSGRNLEASMVKSLWIDIVVDARRGIGKGGADPLWNCLAYYKTNGLRFLNRKRRSCVCTESGPRESSNDRQESCLNRPCKLTNLALTHRQTRRDRQ